MKKKNLKEILKQEIESEAAALERRVDNKKSLTSLEMPEDSYDELMERIQREKEMEPELEARSLARITPFRIRRKKILATVAMAMAVVLVLGAGLGVNGARLYLLNVEKREGKEAFDIITDIENIYYIELSEDEAYEKIEEEIGILALRLGYKPKGMELNDIVINAEMGEVLMEYSHDDYILSIYENKQNVDASFQTQLDGEVVEKVETFYFGKDLEILKIDKVDGNMAYQAQLEYGNAFYYLISDMELEEFENILHGIIFKND